MSQITKLFSTDNNAKTMVTMAILSVITPISSEFLNFIRKSIMERYPLFFKYLYELIYKKQRRKITRVNKIIIEDIKLIKKNGSVEFLSQSNLTIINAILYKIKSLNLDVSDSSCKFSNEIIVYKPNEEIVYNDFKISYEDKTTVINDQTQFSKIIIINSIRSPKEIKEFIKQCYDEYYIKFLCKEDTDLYYLYKTSETNINTYNKCIVNNKITFNDVFFPEKNDIIKLIDDLNCKNINKLGLLLHGVPGSGKTSIIKSIANYTKRHVISIKLSEIQSDNDLMKIFFQDYLYLDGCYKFVIPFNKRIYILEDIDAESEVVLKREYKKQIKSFKSPYESESESDSKSDKSTNDSGITLEEKSKSKKKKKTRIETKYSFNKLTLSGILNVLDGFIELTDTIIIMTSNHPEHLDDALIRPGRINMTIETKKMTNENANQLANKILKENYTKFEIKDYQYTPAQIENYLLSSKSSNEFLEKLKKNEFNN